MEAELWRYKKGQIPSLGSEIEPMKYNIILSFKSPFIPNKSLAKILSSK